MFLVPFCNKRNPSSPPTAVPVSNFEKNAGRSVQCTRLSSPSTQFHAGLGCARKKRTGSQTVPSRCQVRSIRLAKSSRQVDSLSVLISSTSYVRHSEPQIDRIHREILTEFRQAVLLIDSKYQAVGAQQRN